MVGCGREECAYGVLAEGVVVRKGVLCLPLVGAVCALGERVAAVGLTYLVATRREAFVVVRLQVVCEAAHKLKSRNDVANLQRCGRPCIVGAVEDILR